MTDRIAVLLTLLLCASASPAQWAEGYQPPPDRHSNPYGVMLGMGGGDNSDFASIHFGWAAELCGDWGHVRVGSGVHNLDMDEAVRALAICRAKRLTPVFTGLYVPEEYRIPGGADHAPYVREDGYPLAAERYGAWAAAMAELNASPPYYEVGNEINGKWEPAAYGRFIIDVSRAMKAELPGIKIVSAGLAGWGGDFLDEMLTAVPEAAAHIDCWGLHPYCANHPPAYDKDVYAIKGHRRTAEVLAEHGITDPRFVMTESGYELGNRSDAAYPRITDELRADYLVQAYRDVWVPDERVTALTLFMLQAVHYPQWRGWVLVRDDCTKTETFRALARVPKPRGRDWMPAGPGRIQGTVFDLTSLQPLERVFVYTVPGVYAAETRPDGSFVLDGLPEGRYEVRVFRDGFDAGPPSSVEVTAGRPVLFSALMDRYGFVPTDMSGDGRLADGWLPSEAAADDHYAVDRSVKLSGEVSQRLSARPGRPVGIWRCTGYATALPDRAYAAEVWVKASGLRRGSGEGPSFSLAITDSHAQSLSTARVTLPPCMEGDFDWTPLCVTLAPYPPGRRLVLTCSLDAEAGTVWFDRPYVHYASYPVSSREGLTGRAGGAISGEVMGGEEERLAGAAVCLRPGNIWALSGNDGTYTLRDIPQGTYDLWAFGRGWAGASVFGLTVGDEPIRVDTHLAKPPAPRSVQNPGFEKAGAEMAHVPGWTRYGEFDGRSDSGWHTELTDHPRGVQARTGEGFAGSIAGSNVKNGGIYQIVEVDPGAVYEAAVWVYTYQTPGNGQRGDVACRLGLDPTGGTDPAGPHVLWTTYRPSHKEWSQLRLAAAANTDRMTIFLDQLEVVGLMYCLNVFDDVTFEEAPGALPDYQIEVPPSPVE